MSTCSADWSPAIVRTRPPGRGRGLDAVAVAVGRHAERVQAIVDLDVLRFQAQSRGLRAQLEERGEVDVVALSPASPWTICSVVAASGMVTSGLARRLEAEMEVLEQQLGRERGREVEVDVGRRLVAGERRAHDAVVEELQEVGARDAALLGQHRDLGHALGHHAEHQVVADLDQSRALALPDVGDAAAQQLQVRPGPLDQASRGPEATIVRRPLSATLGLPLTGAASIAVPRCCAVARMLSAAAGEIVVESTIRPGATRRARAARGRRHLLDVGRAGDHREDDVPVGQIGRRVDDRGAELARGRRPSPGSGCRR